MNAILPAQSALATGVFQPADAARQNSAAGARVQRQEQVTEATLRKELNVGILQASMEVSIRAGDESQALLFRTAIEGINAVRGGFEKGFGEARDILSGLGVFNGAVEADVTKTREMVLQGYDRFMLERLPTSDQQM